MNGTVIRLVSGKYHNTQKKTDYTACAGHIHTEYTVHKIIVFFM